MLSHPIARNIHPAERWSMPGRMWPPWARDLAAQAQPGEASLAETIERVIAPFGSAAFKLWYAETFGVWTAVCNCADLKARWRVEYAYDSGAMATRIEGNLTEA